MTEYDGAILRSTLDRFGVEGDTVLFARQPDDETDVPMTVNVPWERFLELRQPDHITVTVRAGDLLNHPHPFVPVRAGATAWCEACGDHKSQHSD